MENYRMRRQPGLPADLFLSILPEHHNEIVWEQVYQKYAPLIFGVILNMTGEKRIAVEIFKEAFMDLKRKRIFSRADIALCQSLLRQAYKLTLKYLELRGRSPHQDSPFHSRFRLLNLLYFDLVSTREAAQKLNMDEQDILVQLRMEIQQLRKQAREYPAYLKVGSALINQTASLAG